MEEACSHHRGVILSGEMLRLSGLVLPADFPGERQAAQQSEETRAAREMYANPQGSVVPAAALLDRGQMSPCPLTPD